MLKIGKDFAKILKIGRNQHQSLKNWQKFSNNTLKIGKNQRQSLKDCQIFSNNPKHWQKLAKTC